jgi:hypothetical protein
LPITIYYEYAENTGVRERWGLVGAERSARTHHMGRSVIGDSSAS